MTATRIILLALLCSAVSVTLAAQEAGGGASPKDETPEKKESAQPGQIPMIFGIPGQQGQNPWMFGGAPGGGSDKEKDGNDK